MPTSRQIFAATSSLSPVSTFTATPPEANADGEAEEGCRRPIMFGGEREDEYERHEHRDECHQEPDGPLHADVEGRGGLGGLERRRNAAEQRVAASGGGEHAGRTTSASRNEHGENRSTGSAAALREATPGSPPA